MVSTLDDFARSYTAAWCSQHAASVAQHYSLNGSLRINDGEPAVGRLAITEAAQSFMSAFPDLQVKMDDLRMGGGQPQYHWTLLGKNTGPGGTGHQICISGFEMWRMGEDGLIAESQGHFDGAEYQRQLQGGGQ